MADEAPSQRYTAALANEIEHKWQDRWDEDHVFYTPNRTGLLSDSSSYIEQIKRCVLNGFGMSQCARASVSDDHVLIDLFNRS